MNTASPIFQALPRQNIESDIPEPVSFSLAFKQRRICPLALNFLKEVNIILTLARVTHFFFHKKMEEIFYGPSVLRTFTSYHLRNKLKELPYAIAHEDKILTEDGIELEIMTLQACQTLQSGEKKAIENAETVIICTGSMHSFERYAVLMAEAYLKKGINVILHNSRGFGGSKGTPSEKGNYLDIEAVYQYTKQQHLVRAGKALPDDKILVHGYSFGGAVAAQLAAHHPIHFFGDRIWSQAYDVALDYIQSQENSYLVKLIFRLTLPIFREVIKQYYAYNTEAKIKQIQGYILLACGTHDDTMLPRYAKKLEQAYRSIHLPENRKLMFLEKNMGHLHADCIEAISNNTPAPWFYQDNHFNLFLSLIWPKISQQGKE